MDLLAAAAVTFGPLAHRMPRSLWDEYRTGYPVHQGTAVNAQGNREDIPYRAGSLSVAALERMRPAEAKALICVTGQFTADESFVALANILLEEEEKKVLLILVDQATEDVYFLAYGFDGYVLQLWTGTYACYAFIVDPIGDEVLGVGYPRSDDLEDVNPITLTGPGPVQMDFMIVDVEALADAKGAPEGLVTLAISS